MDRIVAQQTPPVRAVAELSMERRAFARSRGRPTFESLDVRDREPVVGHRARRARRVRVPHATTRAASRSSPRALDAAVDDPRPHASARPRADAVLARIRALRIRDNAFIQIDPPPPLGLRYSAEEFEKQFTERSRRPHRPSAVYSAAR